MPNEGTNLVTVLVAPWGTETLEGDRREEVATHLLEHAPASCRWVRAFPDALDHSEFVCDEHGHSILVYLSVKLELPPPVSSTHLN